MNANATDETQGLEAAIQDLNRKLEQTDAEIGKAEAELETTSQAVAVEFWAAKKGNPHAEEHHAAAIAQARGLEAKLQELALARRGLLSQLAGQQGRLREIEEKRAAEQRERQRQEYEAHVQQAKTDAARAVQNAVEAYEGAAVRCGEATSAIEHLCAIGGNEGRFAGGQLIDELLAGCAPAVLEAKGYTVISEWQRPPYGRLEFRLLPVRASVPLAQES